jgi:hypothetical protein
MRVVKVLIIPGEGEKGGEGGRVSDERSLEM